MKKVAVLLAEGFEEIEALTVVDVLRRLGATCNTVSIKEKEVTSSHNIKIIADKILDKEIEEYDMIVLPGGLPGADNLAENKDVIELIQKFNKENKYIAAICASPAVVLPKTEIIKEKNITSYPDAEYKKALKEANYKEEIVVIDGNLITSRGPATSLAFSYKIAETLGYDTSKLKEGMLYNFLKDNSR